MPTDDISMEPAEAPEGTDVGSEPMEEPAAAPAQFTPEQIVEGVAQAIASGNQEVLEHMRSLTQSIQSQQEANRAPADTSDDFERLATDPKSWAREQWGEFAKSDLAPILSRSLEADRDERIESRVVDVDEKFGEGFFDTQVRDRLTETLKTQPINRQADPAVIDASIRGIIGNLLMDSDEGPKLEEAMQKAAKARQERNVMTPPNMMGPGRVSQGRAQTITPAVRDMLGKFQEVGIKMSENDLKDAMQRGDSLDDWMPLFQKRGEQGATK